MFARNRWRCACFFNDKESLTLAREHLYFACCVHISSFIFIQIYLCMYLFIYLFVYIYRHMIISFACRSHCVCSLLRTTRNRSLWFGGLYLCRVWSSFRDPSLYICRVSCIIVSPLHAGHTTCVPYFERQGITHVSERILIQCMLCMCIYIYIYKWVLYI